MIWSIALAGLTTLLLVGASRAPRVGIPPALGASAFGSVLLLRATASLTVIAALIVKTPKTDAFAALTDWCVEEVYPPVGATLDVSGHSVGDLALSMPALAVATLGISAAFGIYRSTQRLSRWLRSNTLGRGPRGSLLVRAEGILLATTGLLHPRVIVSPGALTQLDDLELTAGLRHEQGHIERAHRFITLVAALAVACSRLIPGSRRAFNDLAFQLERDADWFAISRAVDPVDLASAIHKAALRGPRAATHPSFAGLSGSETAERIRDLLREPAELDKIWSRRFSVALILLSLLCALGLTAAFGSLIFMGIGGAHLALPFA